jgi:predicted nucleic acid-binding protein
MSGFLLDTNVLSEFNRRGEPDPLVKQWLEAADTDSLYASVLTFGEIRLGVELLPPSKRRMQLEQWLDRDLPEWFEGRILPVDQSIADRWGLLRAQAQLKGDRCPSLTPCSRQPPFNPTLQSFHAT